MKLQKELQENTYKPGKSICFVVTKPKVREIFAADFRDRIVHHVLVNYLEKIWEPKFIDQSYACRRSKGAHQAILSLRKYIRKVNKRNDSAYYLQLDIQSFFVSLNKDILFEIIKRKVKNPKILWLTKTIIYHNPTDNYYAKSEVSLFKTVPSNKSLFRVPCNQGLPIGNLTSQFFANVYLNELDQFVKHKLKAQYYLRYVDDFIILSNDKEQLKIWRDEISDFLQEKLKLKIHPKKQVLQNVYKGINFVGYIVKPDYTLTRRRVVKSLKEKLRLFNLEIDNKEKSSTSFEDSEIFTMLATVNSYFGQFKHAKTFNLRRNLFENKFNRLKRFLKPVDKNFSHFKIISTLNPSFVKIKKNIKKKYI